MLGSDRIKSPITRIAQARQKVADLVETLESMHQNASMLLSVWVDLAEAKTSTNSRILKRGFGSA